MESLNTIAWMLLDIAAILAMLLLNGFIVGLSILAIKLFLEELRGDKDGK